MLTAALVVIAVAGLARALWEEVSEQRRLGRMARECGTGGRP